MRVKLPLTAIILFVLSATMPLAAAETRKPASDPAVPSASSSEVADAPADLPRVAHNQQRPMPRLLCADCEELPSFDDGSYVEGGCNCSRICYEGHYGCNLSISNNGCQAGTYPNQCSSCWNGCHY